MKDYNEIAKNVLKRRDIYLSQKKQQRSIAFRTTCSVFGAAVVFCIGAYVYNSKYVQYTDPSNVITDTVTTSAVPLPTDVTPVQTQATVTVSPVATAAVIKPLPEVTSHSTATTAAVPPLPDISGYSPSNVAHGSINTPVVTTVSHNTVSDGGSTTNTAPVTTRRTAATFTNAPHNPQPETTRPVRTTATNFTTACVTALTTIANTQPPPVNTSYPPVLVTTAAKCTTAPVQSSTTSSTTTRFFEITTTYSEYPVSMTTSPIYTTTSTVQTTPVVCTVYTTVTTPVQADSSVNTTPVHED